MTTKKASLSKAPLLALLCTMFAATNISVADTGKLVHNFMNLSNGANPQSSLVSDSAGNLYGTTYFGGAHDYGEVFKLTPTSAGKFTQTTIYSFAGAPNDGAYPFAAVTVDSAGNIYGTTVIGGSATACYSGCGSVFKLAPNSSGGYSESVLFSFPGGTPGSYPTAAVILDSSGSLYGAAGCYGYCDTGGAGAVFKLSPSGSTWVESTLYAFTGGADGAFPTTTPVFDSAGNLYGTTLTASGSYGGVVYEVSPGASGWTQKVIHVFSDYPTDGSEPEGGLIIDSSGNLFGTASHGGTCSSNGTVFELSPSSGGTWTEKQLYCFGGYPDGQIPEGTVAFDSSGNLYGTTFEGGTIGYGVVYQLTPNSNGTWTEHVIKNFTGGNDGATPVGGVAFDPSGFMYATSYEGDSQGCLYNYGFDRGCGAVLRLTPNLGGPWPSTTISHFASTDTAVPSGALIADSSGNYYGTGSQGGVYGYGQVFKLTFNNGSWTETDLYDFTGVNGDGIYPSGNLVFDKSGNLYGTTQLGGTTGYCSNFAPGCGIVYQLSPASSGAWKETILYSFQIAIGGGPVAGVSFDKHGNLFGATLQGGLNYCNLSTSQGCGMVYELTPATGGKWTEHTLYQFTGLADGGNPLGGVVLDSSGNIYGTTNSGGYNGSNGTAFELSAAAHGAYTFNVIHSFGETNSDAFSPTSGLIFDNAGNLYGESQGPSDGSIYELTPAAGSWNSTVLYSFTGKPDGATPTGGLILDSAGTLHGATWYGGKSLNCNGGCGTVFTLTPSTSGWTEAQQYSFTGVGDGGWPISGVTLDSTGNIFTTTTTGGGGHQGTVFEVIP